MLGSEAEITVDELPIFANDNAATDEVALVQLVPTANITARTVLVLIPTPVMLTAVPAPSVPLSNVRGANEVGPRAVKAPDPALKYVAADPPK